MSPPTPKVVNVCKSARESEGYKSFVAWYDDEKNVYIGGECWEVHSTRGE